MQFLETPIPGAFVIEPNRLPDERGFFMRQWCADEFRNQGLTADFVQSNRSYTKEAGTLRGLHYQVPPFAEDKLVRCIAGAIFDVIVDLREASTAYGEWFGKVLSADDAQLIYVPKGCTHGFLTLENETEVNYLTTAPYAPEAERGIRYDDPAFGIEWPAEVRIVSEKDKRWSDYQLTVTS